MVDAVALSGDWVELEEGEKLVGGVKVTVVYNSGAMVIVVPGMSGDGWVGVGKVGRVDVSVTEVEVLSAIGYVVEPGKVTRGVVADVALVLGSEVATTDSGELATLTAASCCELQTDIEDRAGLVPEVKALKLLWEGLVDPPYVSGPVTVTEDVLGEATAVSAMSDIVVLPMDEEVRAVSVMVGRPELGEEGIVGVRVPAAPEVAGGAEMAVEDKLTVGRLFKEVRLGMLREGGRVAMVAICVGTAWLVSEVSREDQVGVAEVSGVPVAKMEVGEVMWEGEWVTELGKDTRDVAADVVCVTGGVVSMAGNGVPFVMSAVTSFVLEPDTEDRTLLVMEVNTLLVPREEGLCVPEARVSVSVTEDVSM